MIFNVIRSILEAAVALRDISDEQMLDNALSVSIISQNRSKLSELLDTGGKI